MDAVGKGNLMTAANKFNVVVFVDAQQWSRRKEDDVLEDWLRPLCDHPRIDEIVFAGAVKPFAHLKVSPKLRFLTGNATERDLLLKLGSKPGVEGVLRLSHNSKMRFPILAD